MKFFILATSALVPRVTALRCFACSQRFDHYGNPINGNVRCVNLDGDEHLIDCDDEYHDSCMTETRTEWKQEGHQTYQLVRACGKSKPNITLDEVICNQMQSTTSTIISKDRLLYHPWIKVLSF